MALSERPFLLVVPAKGEVAYVAPAFEERRAREVIKFSHGVRVWQEDEDALALVPGILRDRGVSTAKIGVEERVRFFIADAPMIAIYGEFGVRLEDCLYITPDGPRWFTQPSPSIE